IKITKEHKWIIVFKIRYKLFKYLVILFKLTNGASLFSYFINSLLFYNLLNNFYTIYFNNILIYSKNLL
ncbi:hypothetical protein K469DRAFT_560336, partial [Zopfia rhizophila CBS 207.26]